MRPLARHSATQRIALDTLTQNRAAAWHRLAPARTASKADGQISPEEMERILAHLSAEDVTEAERRFVLARTVQNLAQVAPTRATPTARLRQQRRDPLPKGP